MTSRGAVLSTSEVQWATTKFDGVWENDDTALPPPIRSSTQGGPDGTSEQSERHSPAHQASRHIHPSRWYRCGIDFARGRGAAGALSRARANVAEFHG